MRRGGKVYMKNVYCGVIQENDEGYLFSYDDSYLKLDKAEAISLTLPLTNKTYKSKTLFAFFDGLIPEGWLLNLVEKNWKINDKDRMGLLLACCKDTIGSISVINHEKL